MKFKALVAPIECSSHLHFFITTYLPDVKMFPHRGAGKSGVWLSAGSPQDLVNWYCNLLARLTV